MTPEQIALVEDTVRTVDLPIVVREFYRLAFEREPDLSSMFSSEPAAQTARFAAELAEIVRSIRSLNTFESRVRALGVRHRGYGVRSVHYEIMGEALLAALANTLGDRWTFETAQAWTMAYNLTAETMMQGALQNTDRS